MEHICLGQRPGVAWLSVQNHRRRSEKLRQHTKLTPRLLVEVSSPLLSSTPQLAPASVTFVYSFSFDATVLLTLLSKDANGTLYVADSNHKPNPNHPKRSQRSLPRKLFFQQFCDPQRSESHRFGLEPESNGVLCRLGDQSLSIVGRCTTSSVCIRPPDESTDWYRH